MKNRLLRSMLLVALVAVVITLALVAPRLYLSFETDALAEMRDLSAALKKTWELAEDKEAFLHEAKRDMPNVRFTWVNSEGEVWYDSEVPEISEMENHAARSEIEQAFASGNGSASRYSSSLRQRTHYYASRLSDGSVLRIAKTDRTVVAELLDLLPSFLLIAVLTVAVLSVLAGILARRIVTPINRLDLDHPEENDADVELAPLLRRLTEQNKRIQAELQTNHENAQMTMRIASNMTEGLIMLSARGHIVSINHSAAEILDSTVKDLNGQHYVAACRDLAFHDVVMHALEGVKGEHKIILAGKSFHVLADPVLDEGTPGGAIILLLDITERERAEATRREFTANVSHELKTPLTVIAGYAEIMHAGLSDVEDHKALSGKVLDEARRLLTLIEDIIQLSRLDEGTGITAFTPVDLCEIARTVIERAAPLASARNVSVSLSGDAPSVTGSAVLLDEMLHNVIDNAIRYNREGGSVEIALSSDEANVIIRVMDTGVGIAQEHHARIFERFYRVDKSHSRTTGGTGLGLSIVKHCVQNHHGHLALESQVGKGSSIIITLPLESSETNSASSIG